MELKLCRGERRLTEKDEEAQADVSQEFGAIEIPQQSLHAPVAEAWSPDPPPFNRSPERQTINQTLPQSATNTRTPSSAVLPPPPNPTPTAETILGLGILSEAGDNRRVSGPVYITGQTEGDSTSRVWLLKKSNVPDLFGELFHN